MEYDEDIEPRIIRALCGPPVQASWEDWEEDLTQTDCYVHRQVVGCADDAEYLSKSNYILRTMKAPKPLCNGMIAT